MAIEGRHHVLMTNKHIPPSLDTASREKIAELVTRFGEEYARAALDLPRQTLARALAGLGIRRATADMIRTRLGKLSADG